MTLLNRLNLTVEELDDIGKVHAVGQDDVSVGLEQGEGEEQHHVRGADVARGPYHLPGREHVLVEQLALEV